MLRGVIGLTALVPIGVASGPAVRRAERPVAAPSALVFDAVTVIDVEHGTLVPMQRVVIVGNRIRAMGRAAAIKVPKGAQVVDAHGKYLMPGLWDMHTHSRRYTDFFYPLFLANGVTGIRDAWSEVPLDTLFLWRREILAGTRVGPPRQLIAGPALDEASPCTRSQGEGHICVADTADARHVVDSLKAAGVDYIKTYGLGRQVYFAVASEARRVGLGFGGHLNEDVATAIEAADSGAMILDHLNTSGDLESLCLSEKATAEQCRAVAEHFKRDGTWWSPTLIRLATGTRMLASRLSINPEQLQGIGYPGGETSTAIITRFYNFVGHFWKGTPYRTDWLHDSTHTALRGSAPTGDTGTRANGFFDVIARVGLPIVAGTDAGAPVLKPQPPGFALHVELALYVAAGLTPLEALRTATLNPAKAIHATDSLGTVATGKLADLVLLDANPLADITNTTTIRAVVANGRYYDRATLDKLIADVQTRAKTEPRPFGMAR